MAKTSKPAPPAAVAHVAAAAAKPGYLTTEWWTTIAAMGLSAGLAVVGISKQGSAQIAAVSAPVVLALIYAYTRAHTKGALAQALEAVFPQYTQTVPDGAGDGSGAPTPPASPALDIPESSNGAGGAPRHPKEGKDRQRPRGDARPGRRHDGG